jgi:hypothetical protein
MENLYRYDIQPVNVKNLFTSLDKALENLSALMAGEAEDAYRAEVSVLVSGFMDNLQQMIAKHYRSTLDSESDEIRYPLDESQFELEMLMHLFPNMFEAMPVEIFDLMASEYSEMSEQDALIADSSPVYFARNAIERALLYRGMCHGVASGILTEAMGYTPTEHFTLQNIPINLDNASYTLYYPKLRPLVRHKIQAIVTDLKAAIDKSRWRPNLNAIAHSVDQEVQALSGSLIDTINEAHDTLQDEMGVEYPFIRYIVQSLNYSFPEMAEVDLLPLYAEYHEAGMEFDETVICSLMSIAVNQKVAFELMMEVDRVSVFKSPDVEEAFWDAMNQV